MRKNKIRLAAAAVCVLTGFNLGLLDIQQNEAKAALLPNPPKLTIVEEVIEPMTAPETSEALPETLYTEADVDMLARLIYTEARGVDSKTEQAAVVWCVLNRLDNPNRLQNSIAEVVCAPYQFDYRPWVPVEHGFRELAEDVLKRWQREKSGEAEVGRVLPAEYQYFNGCGLSNRFTAVWRSGDYWDWSLPSPYED